METSPQFQQVDQALKIQIAVMTPTAILLENGPGFSLLTSQHISTEPVKRAIVFQDSCLLRIEANGASTIRRYSKVEVKKDQQTHAWIASPNQFEALFLQPSLDPYAMIELDQAESEMIARAFQAENVTTIFSFFRKRFGALPRFYSSTNTILEAGESYASAKGLYPRARFV